MKKVENVKEVIAAIAVVLLISFSTFLFFGRGIEDQLLKFSIATTQQIDKIVNQPIAILYNLLSALQLYLLNQTIAYFIIAISLIVYSLLISKKKILAIVSPLSFSLVFFLSQNLVASITASFLTFLPVLVSKKEPDGKKVLATVNILLTLAILSSFYINLPSLRDEIVDVIVNTTTKTMGNVNIAEMEKNLTIEMVDSLTTGLTKNLEAAYQTSQNKEECSYLYQSLNRTLAVYRQSVIEEINKQNVGMPTNDMVKRIPFINVVVFFYPFGITLLVGFVLEIYKLLIRAVLIAINFFHKKKEK